MPQGVFVGGIAKRHGPRECAMRGRGRTRSRITACVFTHAEEARESSLAGWQLQGRWQRQGAAHSPMVLRGRCCDRGVEKGHTGHVMVCCSIRSALWKTLGSGLPWSPNWASHNVLSPNLGAWCWRRDREAIRQEPLGTSVRSRSASPVERKGVWRPVTKDGE